MVKKVSLLFIFLGFYACIEESGTKITSQLEVELEPVEEVGKLTSNTRKWWEYHNTVILPIN